MDRVAQLKRKHRICLDVYKVKKMYNYLSFANLNSFGAKSKKSLNDLSESEGL